MISIFCGIREILSCKINHLKTRLEIRHLSEGPRIQGKYPSLGILPTEFSTGVVDAFGVDPARLPLQRAPGIRDKRD
jgi:hypothetical protein